MRFMVIVKATAESEKEGALPDPGLVADMNKYTDELIKEGVLLGYEGLHSSSKGARVHLSGKNYTVTDGPFAETKELIAGFMLWQVKSLEEAIERVKRFPNPDAAESDVEIRQVFEPEDFAYAFSEEDIQEEKTIRAQLADQAAKK
jgi:hypothetical protein